MIKFRSFSKLYDDAKAKWEKREDYEIAEIAKEDSRLKGQIAGAAAGIAVSALARNKANKLIKAHPKAVEKIKKIDPGVLDTLTSNLTLIPATIAGSHYGGEVTGNIAKNLVLKEIDSNRSGKKSRYSKSFSDAKGMLKIGKRIKKVTNEFLKNNRYTKHIDEMKPGTINKVTENESLDPIADLIPEEFKSNTKNGKNKIKRSKK